MRRLTLMVLAAGMGAGVCAQTRVTVTNPTPDFWTDAPVALTWKDGMPGPKGGALLSARGSTETLPVQTDDLDGDGRPDELAFLVNLAPGESKMFTLSDEAPGSLPPDRAHAGMYMKTPELKGMEGPGWESDEIAFRLYWDERNAVDVFAKIESILSLDGYARRDIDYHRLSKYGMDVLKVGKAVGIGGFGLWQDGRIHKVEKAERDHKVVADGPVRAVTDLLYTNWQVGDRRYDLRARMIAWGGQRWAEAQLELKAADGGPLPRLVTGIVRHEDTELVKDESAALVGRWGRQALGEGEVPKAGDLGLGIVADPAQVAGIGEDEFNTHLILRSEGGKASYRYNASWEKEPGAAKSADGYRQILRRIARLHPVVKVEQEQAEGSR